MKSLALERWPAWSWLLWPALALWPVWTWSAARFADGSDDPLGIMALLVLAAILVRDRRHFTATPRLVWLLVSAGLAAAAMLGVGVIPVLMRGVLAVLAICAALFAVRDPRQPLLAMTGLGLLSLPVLSSLQFFAGYPMRLITAEATRLLLSANGFEVGRSGAALVVSGRLVMVDAPCSGIQMVWAAYFTAFTAAAWLRVADHRLLRVLPFVGVTVLTGNIVRNSLLVMKESGLVAWPAWTHEFVGLVVFAAVCALVLWVVHRVAGQSGEHAEPEPIDRGGSGIGVMRPVHASLLALYAALFCLPFWPGQNSASGAPSASVEWPQQYDGRVLRPLALSSVEQRFADRFPGAIGRFADGEGTLVLRQVMKPTRMLHPANDCYRALGYKVSDEELVRRALATHDASAGLQRCFLAERNGRRARVCEHIVDAAGQVYTDTSAWYWAAVTGRSSGPWQAVTQARPL